jgi:hypothetical protein
MLLTFPHKSLGEPSHILHLNGQLVGSLSSVEGGHASHEILMELGGGMSRDFYEWIKHAMAQRPVRMDGTITPSHFNPDNKRILSFSQALITEIGFPALDGASKDAAKMTIKFSPTRFELNDSSENPKIPVTFPKIQKLWFTNNFRLRIDGLEEACKHVTHIDPIIIILKRVGKTNLVITLPIGYSKSFYDWHEATTMGKPTSTKNGTLDYLSPDMQSVLHTLTFHNLGINRLSLEKFTAGGTHPVQVKMYSESVSFDAKAVIL